MTSSPEEMQDTSEEQKLDEDISISLLGVIKKRTEVPKKLKRVEAKILKHQKSQAEHITVLPSTNPKRVASRYSLRKPLPKEFEICSEKPNLEEMMSYVEHLCEKQVEVKKAMEDLKKKNK